MWPVQLATRFVPCFWRPGMTDGFIFLSDDGYINRHENNPYKEVDTRGRCVAIDRYNVIYLLTWWISQLQGESAILWSQINSHNWKKKTNQRRERWRVRIWKPLFFRYLDKSPPRIPSVPSMVADLVESSLVGYPLEGLLFGGSPTPDSLVVRASRAFPKASMYVSLILCLIPAKNWKSRTQGYGLTETNSIAVSVWWLEVLRHTLLNKVQISGDDYLMRPTCA